ncbi:MAG: tetratricopeptide repeat protein [Chloroflexota bacterium]
MPSLTLQWLGTPQIELEYNPVHIEQAKPVALLAYLSTSQGRQPRDVLATMFWPELGQTDARGNLRHVLWSLRKAIGHQWFEADRNSIGLLPGSDVHVDVVTYAKRGTLLADDTEVVNSSHIHQLMELAALYRGDFLAGFTLPDSSEFEEWCYFRRETLRQQQTRLLTKLVAILRGREESEQSLAYARQLLLLNPLHEPTHRLLMELYVQSGQQAAALRQYTECLHILEQEVGVPPQGETTELYESIRARRHPLLTPTSLSYPLTNPQMPLVGASHQSPTPTSFLSPVQAELPVPSTSFFGRTQELAEIRALLTEEVDCRLLTVVGPGGTGKTRLAIESSAQVQGSFTGGVVFVPLAECEQPMQIPQTIMDTLNLRLPSDADIKSRLLGYAQDKELLLVLDNFEHLSDGADLLTELLHHTSKLQLLVTSRESLDLEEEWLYHLDGLEMPPSDDTVSLDSTDLPIETYSAIQLFLDRARRVRSDFRIIDEDIPSLMRICQLVNGLPLGLELAAPWVNQLTLRDVATKMANDLDFLSATKQSLPERHHSLRSVFEQSWQLLHNQEQDALRKLTIFHGGFTRRSAADVAQLSLPVLVSLTNKSLIDSSSSGRYQMHELIRHFAVEKQDQSETPTLLQQRHGQYFLEHCIQNEDGLWGDAPHQVLLILKPDMANIHKAWQWAVGHQAWDLAHSSVSVLATFYEYLGKLEEGERLFHNAAEHLIQSHDLGVQGIGDLLVELRLQRANFLNLLGKMAQAREILEELLAHANQTNRIRQRADCLAALAPVLRELGEVDPAIQAYEEASKLYQTLEIARPLGAIWTGLSYAYFRKQMPDEALTYAQRAVESETRLNNRRGHALASSTLAIAYSLHGELIRCWHYNVEQVLPLYEALDDPMGIGRTLNNIGYTSYQLGRYGDALDYFQRALKILCTVGSLWDEANVLDGLGATHAALGERSPALTSFKRGLELAQANGLELIEGEVLLRMGELYIELGEFAEAEGALQESLRLAKARDNTRYIANAIGALGALAHRTNQLERALDYYSQAVTMLDSIDRQRDKLHFLVQKAILLFEQGDEVTAKALAEEGIQLEHDAEGRTSVSEGRILLARIDSALMNDSH